MQVKNGLFSLYIAARSYHRAQPSDFMIRPFLHSSIFLLIVFFITSCNQNEIPVVYEFQPEENASIVLIGNTFAERLQHYNYFETLLHHNYPDKNLKIRNLGWSGDEITLSTRPLNFPTQDDLLKKLKADYLFICYGLNEAFKGPDSLDAFRRQLTTFLQHLKSNTYNGRSAPQLILVSPIAHEKLGGLLPDPSEHNRNLKRYTQAMKQVASELDIPFIDLFSRTERAYSKSEPLTINGIHLNDKGYQLVSQIMAKTLAIPKSDWEPDLERLKVLVDQKNQQFFYHYRAVNSEYIVGRRKEPWVQPKGGPISYPSEMAKLETMVSRLDSVLWNFSQTGDESAFAQAHQILNDTVQYVIPDKSKIQKPGPELFELPEGFEINLYASEVDFSLTNPVKITFDPQGRMWVTDMPSYPQYLPGAPPNDKILILEDTDGDGVADKETIFADGLYMPNSIEIGKGGVYVSQPPNIWFMKDTDGDGRADEKEIILHGFGTEDVHHTLAAYTWGPDGALYWHTGTFLHSQVETPYGVVRGDYGVTWRYEPETAKLEPYVSYPYANPWGHVFLRDGTEIISDVSTGMNYFAPPLTIASAYPVKLANMRDFLTAASKPKTCGTEIISSRHFPDEFQGDVLLNTFVGKLGINHHKILESGSGIVGQELPPLLQSMDPNFRPVDLQFGPDGALYVVDWYNPIINHGERALRDPLRDHTHGRIWRITYAPKAKLQPVDLTQLPLDTLLDQLKAYEDRTRYRVRTQLRQMEASEVIPALANWVSNLDANDPFYEQHQLEALWVYQQFHQPNIKLLNHLLQSDKESIRTAATRVLFYWRDKIKDAEDKLIALSKDPSMKVRLQALISLSHFQSEKALKAMLEATQLPRDYYMDYVLKETFKLRKPIWWEMFKKNPDFLAHEPDKAAWLLGSLADEKDLAVSVFIRADPKQTIYGWKVLTDNDYDELKNSKAVQNFRETRNALLSQPQEAPVLSGKTLIEKSDCIACHQIDVKLVGPAYSEIAKRYKEADVPQLVEKIIKGGAGNWGDIPMTPHPGLTTEEAESMTRYILSLK